MFLVGFTYALNPGLPSLPSLAPLVPIGRGTQSGSVPLDRPAPPTSLRLAHTPVLCL